jgi:hypothetical protein
VFDFPDVARVPLQLPAEQLAAFHAAVQPLLDLAESGSPHVAPQALLAALKRLVTTFEEDAARYGLLRGVADYVQCTFAQVGNGAACAAAQLVGGAQSLDGLAHSLRMLEPSAQPLPPPASPIPRPPVPQCVVDAAGAWALNPDRRAYRAALGPAAADDALLCEVRCRLVAAGVDDLTQPLACELRGVAAAPPGPAPVGAAVPLFPGSVQAAAGDGAPVVGPDGAVSWAALRRALAAAGGHYLEAVLGGEGRGDPAGAIVLTGAVPAKGTV